jgi:hypothetical protein
MASYSGLWNNEYGEAYSALGQDANIGNAHTAFSRLFAGRTYGRASLRAVLKSLVDGAVGDNATATHKRVKAERDLEANVQGGARTIETFTSINRNTTATDEAQLLRALELSPAPAYPVDRSGNGGGNKLGW